MKKKVILNFTLLPIFFFLSFGIFYCSNVFEEKFKHSTEIIQVQEDSISQAIKQKLKLREQLIEETKNYISKVAQNSNVDIIAPHLVDQSLGNNIDLCFILAQCQIETLFGTAGMGRSKSKKSMFGIDRTYHTYEECIDHYIRNLKKNYLSETRSIHDLMNHYVTHGGYRYAEDPKYEPKLQFQYKEILNKTNIEELEKQYFELDNLIKTEKLST